MSKDEIRLTDIRDALASAGDSWEAGVTTLSTLSKEEQAKRLGVTPPAEGPSIESVDQQWPANEATQSKIAAGSVGAPVQYDLRNVNGKNYVTQVQDQGGCGSCVAFGTVATVEAKLRLHRNNPNLSVNLSEAHLFFCLGKETGAGCSSGWWPDRAFNAFKDHGVADEPCYPYNTANTDCSGNDLCSNWAQRNTKITGYTGLTNKPAEIKKWLAGNKGPVSACFVVYQDFFSYKSGVYKHVTGNRSGGHCVTIIGYDDTLKCWICKNSWGEGWGDKGYFKIGYGQCGIDSWQNHGVNGIEDTGWHKNQKVIGLWTTDQHRNAWVYFKNLGWRKISPDNDNIFFDMLAQLIAAKAAARPVNFYEDNKVIKEIYVF